MGIYHSTEVITVATPGANDALSIASLPPSAWNAALVDENGTAFTPSATIVNTAGE